MNLTKQVQDRLDAMLGPGSPAGILDRVALAADALTAQGQLRGAAEAWIVTWDSDAAKPRAGTGPIRQLVREKVMIMLGFLYAGPIGADVEPETVENHVIDALLGWLPVGRAQGLELIGSRLMSFDADRQLLFRQVVFETSRQRVGMV
jgi:hypothetical protein